VVPAYIKGPPQAPLVQCINFSGVDQLVLVGYYYYIIECYYSVISKTRSQAVARLADRSASQLSCTLLRLLTFSCLLKSSGLHLCYPTKTKRRLPSITFPIELNVTLGNAHIQGKLLIAPARHCPYKAVYQIWSL